MNYLNSSNLCSINYHRTPKISLRYFQNMSAIFIFLLKYIIFILYLTDKANHVIYWNACMKQLVITFNFIVIMTKFSTRNYKLKLNLD